ncbi:SufD family Fe-S cluster assembly protein [Nitrosophilus labii]|uniref:SufD family Fe-S cluster assembly protein n=1 Tax=Nitrosophilus labii TaxID=2706014 RepID=UPI001656CDE1|nr:SufD family Fe-S cluster assembly protein [Nitrosophilus labii]
MRELVLSKMDLNSILSLSTKDKTKATAAVALSHLGLPSKKTEHYRYFDITQLLSKNLNLYQPVAQKAAQDEKLIIEDGAIASFPLDLKIDIKDEIDVDKEHFDQIYYINHIITPNVITIEIDKDMELEVVHKFSKDSVILPYRLEIIVRNGAKVTLYEDFEDENIKESLIFYGWDISLEKDSYFELVRVQDELEKSYSMVASHFVKADESSEFSIKSFDIGEGKICHNLKVDLLKDAKCNAKHLVYTDKEAVRANVIKINHKGKNAKTQQNARHVLKDKSRAIFDALIKVEHSGIGASAHQNNKSILLNDKAYMISKPQLEIYIDELEASHGSTTGQIDPEEIFYLRTRGISEEDAKKMIVLGFMREIIEEVKDEEKKDDIMKRFEEIYNRDFIE